MELHQGGYKYVNPLLECEIAEGRINKLISSFRSELSDLVTREKASGMVTKVSLYFRDLNNGPWYGINEDETFLPASLLKVPLVMAYFKAAESDPGLLNKKVKYSEKDRFEELKILAYPPSRSLELGREYTINELIEAAIVYSDNQSLPLLYKNLPEGYLEKLCTAVGVDPDIMKKPGGSISVKSYSSFFRILFNASYLTKEYSEKVLKLLDVVDFQGGLRAGVPAGITVAQKFGEGGYLSEERQLHDCGIIYYPHGPYLLCVMTSGREISNLNHVIRDISKFVYERVSRSGQGK
ncbi:MAG: class A beta-lactamase-related serine hydrolase [bacterium]|nr:class A beta-lactamase-related serine hydrolase [bacterium]